MASGSMAGRASADYPGDAYHWPASILLAQEAYVAGSRNHTTATAKSRVDHTVELTFWIADPPAVSFYTFHCSKPPTSDPEDTADLQVQPHLVGAEGRFVLVRTLFASGDDEFEYFLYKGDPRSPSLESVPLPDDNRLSGGGAIVYGIVPRGDGDQYLLIALCGVVTLKDYRLHIYSSEDRTWRTQELLNPCPGVRTIAPDKVMLLRDGVLVWVDLLCGMLVCDVLQEPLRARYIPLPEPLPRNREQILKQLIPGDGVRRYRDVACVDGLIKFVEMEHRVTVTEIVEVPPEKPSDPRNKTVLYDSDLIMLSKRKHVDNKPKTLRTMDGWSAMTWTREIGSDCWLKGIIIDVDDILVDDSALSALLPGQRNESAGSLTFKNMYSAYPTLSTDGNDIMYLKSSRKMSDSYPRVVAIDLTEKTLKVEAPGAHPFGTYSPSCQVFIPCALVNHLKMTPGIKVSAIEISQTSSSANEPNNTAICVGEPDSDESENKRPRLSAEKDNHTQDLAQSTVGNVLSSHARPHQNNMRPQLRFNRWEGLGYGGYSSCPPHNNTPLPRCFNKFTGPCNPMFAPSAPAPNMHSYGNYQSPWQQPLLPEQQMAPSRAFVPHVAPHPYFNNWRGARHHGNSQQHPAGNSYYYGGHSGSGNQGFGYRPNYYDYRY